MAEFLTNLAASALSGRRPPKLRRLARIWSVCLLVTGMFAGVLLSASPAAAVAGFGDIDDDLYFTKPVQWMVDNNIVTDTGPCFDPHTPATRGETALYMWRMEEMPEASPHPFSDVTDDDQHRAVSWMYGTEITTGTSPTTFGPDQQLTRAQLAALLHRLAGEPPASGHPFVDVVAGWQQHPVAWMVANKITTGTSPTTFAPNEPVTRAQLATFLYRYRGSPNVTVNPHSSRCDSFTAIDVGGQHSCGIRADGAIACWGNNEYGQADAPEGLFKAVSAGTSRSCGIRTDNTAACWGISSFGRLEAPPGQFRAISAGTHHSCGIAADDTIACWGAIGDRRTDSPEGRFSAISAGDAHTCAIRTDDTVTCWGRAKDGQTDAPEGTFTAISAGLDFSCGIRANSTITCWGWNGSGQTNVPPGSFTHISAGQSHACALRTDAMIECWGWNIHGQTDSPIGSFTDIGAGERHSCALAVDETIVCWGRDLTKAAAPPADEFTEIATGVEHSCALRADKTIVCWGDDLNGRIYPPSGKFIDVTVGERHTCGLRADGSVECWGSNWYGQTDQPDGQFTAISSGGLHSCGIRPNAAIECWGSNWAGQTDPPEGQFTAISAGGSHSCGIQVNAAVACWGLEANGQTDPPDGQFTAISAGSHHSCGLRLDGTITCWGNFSQANIPSGNFTAISAGGSHSCGIRTDATIACWGYYQQVPSGSFASVSVEGSRSCGIRTDATILCWGVPTVQAPSGVQAFIRPREADPSMCRPFGISGIGTAGFPLPSGSVQSTGTARVAVLFVDFADASASHSTQIEAELGLPYAEAYLEASSYQKLDIEFVPLHGWLRAENTLEHYQNAEWGHNGVGPPIETEAVRLADPDIDFTNIDALMVVLPSSHFGGGTATGPIRTIEGTVARQTLINVFPLDGTREPRRWGQVAAHELIHNLGLLDLYAGEGVVDDAADAPADKTWVTSRFGLMGLGVDFPADLQDPRLLQIWLYPDGAQSTGYATRLEAEEMLVWSRWQLGWLDSTQITCVTENEATVTLGPVADPSDNIAMAAIPLSGTDIIVIENRRRIGYDDAREERYANGVVGTFPTLLADGVLIYTVDAGRLGGRLPVAIAGDTGNLQVDRYPVLTVGESVTIRGYTITVQSGTDTTHTVTITKNVE
ncbi:MAG: hypothetical protein F4003_01265 [Acidimicrobiaceae bacterium]|nr:hypothetical protein [Acidimicrobiaceae bacterium]MYC43185.1 hypothetical protein [Acidimicrobiaceae bacterium]